jgi:thiamine kinase-like enzyme
LTAATVFLKNLTKKSQFIKVKTMVTQKDRLETLELIKKLASRKKWQIDTALVKSRLAKPKPRFVYFPFFDRQNQQLFFKGCIFGQLKLSPNLKREFQLQRWLKELNGPVRDIKDFGQEGDIFWYACQYLRSDRGVICREEDISLLTTDHMTSLASGLKQIWSLKKQSLPQELFSELFKARKNLRTFKTLKMKSQKYLGTLRGAFRLSDLDWHQEDEEKVLVFLEKIKSEVIALEGGEGILVHGDLAPNNVFFGPQEIILFDWEWACWCDNLLLALGLDVANFYTRAWQRRELGERLMSEAGQSPWGKKPFFGKSIKVNMIFSVLQKISPMFKYGIYKSRYDRTHFNELVKILRENL